MFVNLFYVNRLGMHCYSPPRSLLAPMERIVTSCVLLDWGCRGALRESGGRAKSVHRGGSMSIQRPVFRVATSRRATAFHKMENLPHSGRVLFPHRCPARCRDHLFAEGSAQCVPVCGMPQGPGRMRAENGAAGGGTVHANWSGQPGSLKALRQIAVVVCKMLPSITAPSSGST